LLELKEDTREMKYTKQNWCDDVYKCTLMHSEL